MTTHYLLPETDASRATRFGTFDSFYGHSATLQVLAPEGKRLSAPAAELVKRQADRADLPFRDIMQAELLILMVAFITEDCKWYPQTLLYATYGERFPFFTKASRHHDFLRLAAITGGLSADELRAAVKAGHRKLGVDQWYDFARSDRSFWECMNMDGLDTLK